MTNFAGPLVPHMGLTVVPPLLKPRWIITPVMDCLQLLAEPTMNMLVTLELTEETWRPAIARAEQTSPGKLNTLLPPVPSFLNQTSIQAHFSLEFPILNMFIPGLLGLASRLIVIPNKPGRSSSLRYKMPVTDRRLVGPSRRTKKSSQD